MKLTPALAEEVAAKLDIMAETPDLFEDYGLTQEQADELADSVPRTSARAVEWVVPDWAVEAVRGELGDRADNLRGIAGDIDGVEIAQARSCRWTAGQLEKLSTQIGKRP